MLGTNWDKIRLEVAPIISKAKSTIDSNDNDK